MGSSRKRRRRSEAAVAEGSVVRRPRKAKRRMVVLLLLLAGAVAAAPTIVANTPLRNLLAGVVPIADWRIQSEQASLSWTGRQTLTGVSIVDTAGKSLLSVETLSLERSLLSLAANKNDLGKLTVVRPVVRLETRAEGSNLEDFLEALARGLKPDDDEVSSTEEGFSVSVEIVDGVVRGLDEPTQQEWLLDQANLSAGHGSATAGGFSISGSMNLRAGKEELPGRMKVQFQQIAEKQNQLDLLAEDLPLAPLEPFLSRVFSGSRLSGTASSTAQIRWTQTPQGDIRVQTSGRLEAVHLDATADALSGDRLQCQRLTVPWEVSVDAEVITIGQLAVEAGWAEFALSGSATVDELAKLSMSNLPKRDMNITGNVKLDQLAAMLPRTLQLREGVQIDSGELEFHATAKPGDTGTAWSAAATVQGVIGTDGRRAIRWEQPIHADVELADTTQGPQLKQLTLSAPFIEANFETNAKEITGNFELDLGEFSQEVGQFVDLAAWQFRGTAEGDLSLVRMAGNQFEAAAKVNLTDLKVAHEGRQIWAEPQLQVDLSATGQEKGFTPQRLAAAVIKLHGPRDAFNLELLEPVDLAEKEKSWLVQLQGNGPLASWAGRLRPWVESVPEQLEGDAQLKAKVRFAAQAVQVLESEGNIVGLRVRDEAMAIDEPRVQFSGDCRWDAAGSSLNSRELQLVSSSLAFRSRDFSVELGSSEGESSSSVPTASGEVAFRANLERLAAAFGMVGGPDSTWPRGTTTGTLKLSSNAERLWADFSASAEQLQVVRTTTAGEAVAGRPDIVWAEPQLEATGKAIYTIAADRLEMQDLKLTGQTVRLVGTATLDQIATEQLLQADGTLEYKEEALDQLLASYLGPEVRFQGDRKIRFQASGRLTDPENSTPTHWSRRWDVSTDAGWSTATVYGLPLSAGRVQGTLSEGQLRFVPLDIGVGEGRLTASPQVIFDPTPQQLILPKGPLVSNVQISPQVSEKMLKYIAPIVAGATRAEGNFSVVLDEARIPFADPKQARVLGRLEVHQMRVAPGPLVADIVALLEQIDALTKGKQLFQEASTPQGRKALTIDNRQIEFQVAEGRVYHRNLEFMVDGVPIRSYGSVGFDQTLVLEIEIPIQDKWIERQRALQSLAGQTIKIPIRGTFSRPQLDQRAVADLSRQMLQGVATEAIGSEINRALDKLFRSR